MVHNKHKRTKVQQNSDRNLQEITEVKEGEDASKQTN